MPIASIGGKTVSPTSFVTSTYFAPITTVAGRTLIVGVSISDTTVSVDSITDNAGNTFHLMQYSSNDGNVRTEIWQSTGIIAYAVDFVTINLTGSSLVSGILWQFSGVKVETYPSPQDTGTATGFDVQLTCGSAASSISSWVISLFAYPDDPFVGFITDRGSELAVTPATWPGGPSVGLAMVVVLPYASGVGAPGYVVPTPLAHSGLVQWAALTLELRSTSGSGGGGTTPSNPQWQPPPSGTLVGFSYTFTVDSSAPAAAGTADVTCSYLESICDSNRTEPGNDAY